MFSVWEQHKRLFTALHMHSSFSSVVHRFHLSIWHWLAFFSPAVSKTKAHGKACAVPSRGQPLSRGTWWSRFSFTRCCYKWQRKKNLIVRLVKTFQPFSTPSLALPLCILTSLLSLVGCQAWSFASTHFLVSCSKQCVRAEGLARVRLSPVNLSIAGCLSARWYM